MSESEGEEISEEEGSEEAEYMAGDQGVMGQAPEITQERDESDKRCTTYVFGNQDHTLGNVLRVVLATHKDVEIVGYSIPHPSETKMLLRVQTYVKDTNVVFNQGLRAIQDITCNLKKQFAIARKS